MRIPQRVLVAGFVLAGSVDEGAGGPQGLPTISTVSAECIKCHKDTDRGIFEQWGESRHFHANVACFECHQARQGEPDAFEHFGQYIATIVSPKDCKRCHEKEASEFAGSHHSKDGRILGSLDNRLAEVVEGNNGFVTEAFPQGVSAAVARGLLGVGWTERLRRYSGAALRSAVFACLVADSPPIACGWRPVGPNGITDPRRCVRR